MAPEEAANKISMVAPITQGRRNTQRKVMIMRMKLLAAVLFLSLSAHAAAGDDYEIRLHRPMRAGDSFRISATGSHAEKTVITAGGKLLRDDRVNYEAALDSIVTITAADRDGKPTRESVTVLKCEKTEAFDRKALLPRGTVVVASLKGKDEVFEIDGKPVDREVHDLLGIFITLSKEGGTDDEIFGTMKRRHVGEAWDVNAELAARDLDDLKLGVRKENVSGKTTLEKVVRAEGTDCLQISAEIVVGKLAPPLPPGFSVESSLIHANFSAKYPFDASAQSPEGTMGLSLTFVARGKSAPDAPEIIIESSLERRVSEKVESVREGKRPDQRLDSQPKPL